MTRDTRVRPGCLSPLGTGRSSTVWWEPDVTVSLLSGRIQQTWCTHTYAHRCHHHHGLTPTRTGLNKSSKWFTSRASDTAIARKRACPIRSETETTISVRQQTPTPPARLLLDHRSKQLLFLSNHNENTPIKSMYISTSSLKHAQPCILIRQHQMHA